MEQYHYLSQLDPDNDFVWDHVKKFGSEFDLTIKKHGCGLCSLCMVIENLTQRSFPISEAAQMAREWNYGSSGPTICEMKVLAPVAADRFGLRFATTSDPEELMEWLRGGGMAIAHSNGDREGHVGILTSGKHYVAVVAAQGEMVTILDPSLTEEKYTTPGRKEFVQVNGSTISMHYRILSEDCLGKIPQFYLFSRK